MPLHPAVVHLPIALSFVLPFLICAFALMIHNNRMSPRAWFIVLGLQLVVTGSGYVALETGETDEVIVKKVVQKEYIHEHEEKAEIFVGSTVIALVVSIAAYFVRREIQLAMKLGVMVITLISAYLGYQAGALGGELVYEHGAASAHTQDHSGPQGILPMEGGNTSESVMPTEENESLKLDENDYSGADEEPMSDEDKQED
jgi:uncharacterized membrane protein